MPHVVRYGKFVKQPKLEERWVQVPVVSAELKALNDMLTAKLEELFGPEPYEGYTPEQEHEGENALGPDFKADYDRAWAAN